MNKHFQEMVLRSTSAKEINSLEVIQTLWSGYGEIVRLGLTGDCPDSVILKYIVVPDKSNSNHPRGWNTDHSHARKIQSYDVEMNWYRDWNERCNTLLARLPSVMRQALMSASAL